MLNTSKAESWVVYKMTLHGKNEGVTTVCDQAEWDAMELARPGYHQLIQSGIANEGEAESLARSAQNEPPGAVLGVQRTEMRNGLMSREGVTSPSP